MPESAVTPQGEVMTRLQNLVKNPTFINDVHPRNDAAFTQALNVFVGKLGPDTLNDESRPVYEALKAFAGDTPVEQLNDAGHREYRALQALQHVLRELDAIMALPDLPPVVRDYLKRKISRVRTEAHRYEEDPTVLSKVLSRSPAALLLSGSLAWLDWLAVEGQDKSFIPLRFPTNIRTTLVFLNWIQHPTANNRQLLDIAVQRLVVPSPGQILYTISIFMNFFYATELYKEVNIISALGLVSLIISMQEAYEARDRITRWSGRRSMRLASSGDLREKMKTNAATLQFVQDWMQEIRQEHKLSPAADDQFSRFQSEISELIKGLRAFANLIASPGTNKGVKEKLSTIVPTAVFGAVQAFASYKNPAGLALIAAWIEFTVYRQLKIAFNKDYTTERAWNFMGQSGGIVPATVLLQSIPLAALGPEIFNDSDAWLYTSTTTLSIAQCTVVDKTGPGTLHFVMGLRRVIRLCCGCVRKTDNGIVLDPEALAEWGTRLEPIMDESADTGRKGMSLDRAFYVWTTAGIMEVPEAGGDAGEEEGRVVEIGEEPYMPPELKELYSAFLDSDDDDEEEDYPYRV